LSEQDAWKRAAAKAALEEISDGMTVGLGTGSTAAHFIDLLGARVAEGWNVQGVPTSEASADQARSLGISLPEMHDIETINVTVDGADEFDPQLNLLKGGGGALLREKIIAGASQRMVVIADDSKLVDHLGAFPLPVEVVPFGLPLTAGAIANACRYVLGREIEMDLRLDEEGRAFVTDGGHFILDLKTVKMEQPEAVAMALAGIPGVVDSGLFLGMASMVITAGPDGVKRHGGVN